MYKMLALIQNENMKIYRRVRTWVMTGIIVAVLLFIAILMATVNGGLVDHMNDYMSMAVGTVSLVIIFTIVIASDSVASEFTWGTIKLLLIRPTKRWKILLSKYISSLLFAIFLLILTFAVSLILGLLFFGTGGEADDANTLGKIIEQYGMQVISLVILVTFSFMISSVFRSSILAIVLSLLILFFGSVIAGVLVGFDQEWSKYLLFLNMDLSIYFVDGLEPPFASMTLGFSIMILIVHFAFFHLVAFWLFNKRDVAF